MSSNTHLFVMLLLLPAMATYAQECFCFLNFDFVCGVDGKTYDNKCLADCEGVTVAYTGECQEPCMCQSIYLPVCGTDGKTYGNDCELGCAPGVNKAYDGECQEPCVCPRIYQPVCGTDGQTYGNACEMDCAGATKDYDGECAAEPVEEEPQPGGVKSFLKCFRDALKECRKNL